MREISPVKAERQGTAPGKQELEWRVRDKDRDRDMDNQGFTDFEGEYTEFSIVHHGGYFSCIPMALLADAITQERAVNLVSSALWGGEVTLSNVGDIAGDDEALQKAVHDLIRGLLEDLTGSESTEWDSCGVWAVLVEQGQRSGTMPENWKPGLEDLSLLRVKETQRLYDFAGLLSSDWADYLPEEVLELAEFHEPMAGPEKFWFDNEAKQQVVDALLESGCSVFE